MSAPVLGFDLTRLDGGAAVADVLLRALALTADDLDPVAAAAGDDWDRIALWHDVEVAARNRRTLAALATATGTGTGANPAGDSGDTGQAGSAGSAGQAGATGSGGAGGAGPDVADPIGLAESADLVGALAVLERTPLGTVDGLLHCLRHDVLDWTWRRHPAGLVQLKAAARASAVICDAAVAAYLREMLSDDTRRRLAAGWVGVVRELPERPAELGPQAAAVESLIDRVRTLSKADVRHLAATNDQTRPLLADWSTAVHSASWAVFVAGRIRAAAAAQLLLVRAVDSAGIPVADRASGCWNLLSGAVQALVTRDLLDGPTLYRLLDPVVTALGPIAR